ncbi:hypothetical protein CDL12_03664 [Handroanthus impetiginosus]|uniref:Uncharacterized protein n=1 Tax=Handroanthus impetiginosus TaxID=429701 RepID=A0A2G9I1J9_9LAMI|nr:hypothetical protein CDL12_03664 [Handroanthus impetiginosus]
MKFLDWYLKIAVVSAMIGGSMELFMIKTGFCVRTLLLTSFSHIFTHTETLFSCSNLIFFIYCVDNSLIDKSPSRT